MLQLSGQFYFLTLLSLQEEVTYEERACEGGKFAVVEVTGKQFDEASKEAVLKLLKYVGGTNDKGEKTWQSFLAQRLVPPCVKRDLQLH